MPQGKISESKVKTTIVMEKSLKSSLESIAKEDMRSFNNLMVSILSEYVIKRTRKN
jgi:hypothetical protein